MQGVAVKDCKVVTTKGHDGRTNGKLIEVVSVLDPLTEDRPAIGQAYITICDPGHKKGLHVHWKKEDRFCVIKGQAEIFLYSLGKLEKIYSGAYNLKVITIPPGIGHGIKCLGDTPCWVLNCPSKAYDSKEPDQYEMNINW